MNHWAIAVVWALAPALHAADLMVGPVGSGAPYTDIQAAVEDAVPGDRVRVLPGVYGGGIVIDKAIELWGPGAALTSIAGKALGIPYSFGPPLTIRDLGPDERVRVVGIGLRQDFASSGYSYMIGVLDCEGPVELIDVTFDTFAQSLPPTQPQGGVLPGGLVIERSQRVVCTQVGWPSVVVDGGNLSSPTQGFHGAVVRESAVWFDRARLVGRGGGQGGHGLLAIDADVTVSSSYLQGGTGTGPASGVAGVGGAGLRATLGSTVRVIGGQGNAVRGAKASDMAFPPFFQTLSAAGTGIAADGTSFVTAAADAVVEGGAGEGQFGPASPTDVQAPGVLLSLGHRLPSLTFDPPVGPPGSVPVRKIEGEPGSFQVQALSVGTIPPLLLAGIGGAALLDPSATFFLNTWLLDGSGVSSGPSPVPPVPSLAGLVLAEQLLQVTPLHFDFSTPTLFAVGL